MKVQVSRKRKIEHFRSGKGLWGPEHWGLVSWIPGSLSWVLSPWVLNPEVLGCWELRSAVMSSGVLNPQILRLSSWVLIQKYPTKSKLLSLLCNTSTKSINIKYIFSTSTNSYYYRKYPNLVRTQVDIISDPNYLVRILLERSFSRHIIQCTHPTFPVIQKNKYSNCVRIQFSFLTKVCNIQNTHYSGTTLVYY